MTRVRHKHPAHLASPVKMYLEKVRYSRTTPTSCDIANWGRSCKFCIIFSGSSFTKVSHVPGRDGTEIPSRYLNTLWFNPTEPARNIVR